MKFNELYINPEGTLLVIEVQCTDTEDTYPELIQIKMIDSQDTYLEDNPSSFPVYTVYQEVNHTKSKVFRLEITRGCVDISDNLLFVYCMSSNHDIIMCPVCNLFRIYQSFMPFVKTIGTSCCCPPKGFIDCILRFKAFELSIKAGNYLQAIQFWNKFFRNKELKNLFGNGCCK